MTCLGHGASVVAVGGASPALALAALERPDVILMPVPADLCDSAACAELLETWLDGLERAHGKAARGVGSVTIVHALRPAVAPGPLQRVSPVALSEAVILGLETPAFLTQAFLARTDGWVAAGWRGLRRVLCLPSGLGGQPLAGCGIVSAVAAGVEALVRALHAEQGHLGAAGARVAALVPCCLAADFAAQLHCTAPHGTPHGSPAGPSHGIQRGGSLTGVAKTRPSRVVDKRGMPDSFDASAAKVFAFLHRADFGETPFADVRDL